MECYTRNSVREVTLLWVILFFMVAGLASSDLDKDRAECGEQLVGIATCLSYVSGSAKSPTPDCCSGLQKVLQTSKKCICILVKDRDDPKLGLKINATLALGLPTLCKAPFANASECPAILHLDPKSADAKVFYDFANSSKGSNATSAANGKGNAASVDSSAPTKSDGGNDKKKRWMAVEMFCGIVLLLCSFPHMNFLL